MSGSFYTSRGDDGFTGLLGEGRVAKSDARMEALGAVDEAGSVLGLARAQARSPQAPAMLLQVQRDLYGLMAELAATPENAARFRVIDGPRVAWLESQVDALSALVEIPREFIVPGDTLEGAYVDLARTVVRRAERRVAALYHEGGTENQEILRYLNRLSSLCFLIELAENQAAGQGRTTLAKG
jgi:cob(I)alamin adenosyltransferase